MKEVEALSSVTLPKEHYKSHLAILKSLFIYVLLKKSFPSLVLALRYHSMQVL